MGCSALSNILAPSSTANSPDVPVASQVHFIYVICICNIYIYICIESNIIAPTYAANRTRCACRLAGAFHMYLYIYVYIYIYIYICICIYIFLYIYIYINIYAYTISQYICTYIHMYTHTHIYIYIYIYACGVISLRRPLPQIAPICLSPRTGISHILYAYILHAHLFVTER